MEDQNREPLIWFMPWRWRRWTWIALAPIALIVYFLSAVPVMRISAQIAPHQAYNHPAWIIYDPVFAADLRIDIVSDVIDWEERMMNQIFTRRYPNEGMDKPFPTIVAHHRTVKGKYDW